MIITSITDPCPKRRGSKWIIQNSYIKKISSFRRLKQINEESKWPENFHQAAKSSANHSSLVRVTAPVIVIAATSKKRKTKKSRLFFCTTQSKNQNVIFTTTKKKRRKKGRKKGRK